MPARLTLPVSAINDAARRDPAAVTRLTQAAARVQAAQLAARVAEVRTATAAYRTALAQMEEQALAQLQATGRRVTSEMRARIGRTLAAAAADPKARVALRRGGLSQELAPTGFDVFGTTRALRLVRRSRPGPSAPAATPRPSAPDDQDRRRTREQVRLRTALAAARGNLRRLEARAGKRASAAARDAQAAAAARQRADAAQQVAEDAKAAARQARAELASAQEALRASESQA